MREITVALKPAYQHKDFNKLNNEVSSRLNGLAPHFVEWREENHIVCKDASERPKRFSIEINPTKNQPFTHKSSTSDDESRLEKYLYDSFVRWLAEEPSLRLKAKRIDEKRKKGDQSAGKNRWLFPDVIGIKSLPDQFKTHNVALATFMRAAEAASKELYSFEIKKEVDKGNVREAYFQAVSNSTWAHFGYLVVTKIEDDETMRELEFLNMSHGIGVIRFDIDDQKLPLDNSQIVIPAKPRESLGWGMIGRLYEGNGDFKKFLDENLR